MSFHPVIDESKCTGCEECAEVCPVAVFAVKDGKSIPANHGECFGCESCVDACGVDAIEI